MLLHSILLSIWKSGNNLGPILCWIFIIAMALELGVVWVKYVMKSDK